MFTGLIEEIGIIKSKVSIGKSFKILIEAKKILEDLSIGDSININGVCQTVVKKEINSFAVEAVEETVKKTTFKFLKVNEKVNLERSLKVDSRLGGHFVLGHVDSVGEIIEMKNLSASRIIKIKFKKEFAKYLIPVGAISIDGISFTIAELKDDYFKISVIPHTWLMTNLSGKKVFDKVNLEFDVLGKYVLNCFNHNKELKITKEWLKQTGF